MTSRINNQTKSRERKWYLHFTLFSQRVYISIPEITGIIGDNHDNLSYLRTTIGVSLYNHIESGSIVSQMNEIEDAAIPYASFIQNLNPYHNQ